MEVETQREFVLRALRTLDLTHAASTEFRKMREPTRLLIVKMLEAKNGG